MQATSVQSVFIYALLFPPRQEYENKIAPSIASHHRKQISDRAMARRAEVCISLAFSNLLLMLLLFFTGKAGCSQEEQKTWCVAKPSSEDAVLNANIDYACSQVDCSILHMDCAHPDKLISHASIAMNLYYQAVGRNYWNCYFDNSALISTTDPSFDHCPYT